MPAGKYTVTATENGKSFTRHMVITKGKPEHVEMIW
jgi:hypothetical protein